MVIGTHEVVGTGIAGGIQAERGERGFLGERGRTFLAKRAVNLFAGNVQETEGGIDGSTQAVPVATHLFQQMDGAEDVGLDGVFRAVDGAAGDVFQIAGVSELVEIDDRLAVLYQPIDDAV